MVGKDPGQIAPQEGELVPIKLCDVPQALGNSTPKKHISGLEWYFWEIQKPRISLVCFVLRMGTQVIGTPGDKAMTIQRSQDFLRP